jgi:hypothetical protein
MTIAPHDWPPLFSKSNRTIDPEPQMNAGAKSERAFGDGLGKGFKKNG